VALLVVDVGERPHAVRVDLALLTAEAGIAAVSDVPPGPHHVSLLLADGWHHGWAFVDADDDVVVMGAGAPPPSATEAVVALPPDAGGWSALTTHLDSRAALVDAADGLPAPADATRFERVLADHGGAAAGVLGALQRAFLEWTLPPEGPDAEAGERWRGLVVAIAAAGPRGVAPAPELLVDAVTVMTTQLAALPPGSADESLREALADLADDLAEDDLETAAATLRAGL
jgi:hypothetical protein